MEAVGHDAIGIATTAKEAYDLAGRAEVALVDVNLVDGATGPEIGKRLAADGVTVVFMTGNPEQLGTGIEGTLGVISKPMFDLELIETIQYATDRHQGRAAVAPRRFTRFNWDDCSATWRRFARIQSSYEHSQTSMHQAIQK